MNGAELEAGGIYLVDRGPHQGRAVFCRLDGARTALVRFPASATPSLIRAVPTASIACRWDDPGQVKVRAERAELTAKVKAARDLLAGLGLDVLQPGSQRHRAGRPRPDAVVAPSMGHWTVAIDLDAFLHRLAPRIGAPADTSHPKGRRRR